MPNVYDALIKAAGPMMAIQSVTKNPLSKAMTESQQAYTLGRTAQALSQKAHSLGTSADHMKAAKAHMTAMRAHDATGNLREADIHMAQANSHLSRHVGMTRLGKSTSSAHLSKAGKPKLFDRAIAHDADGSGHLGVTSSGKKIQSAFGTRYKHISVAHGHLETPGNAEKFAANGHVVSRTHKNWTAQDHHEAAAMHYQAAKMGLPHGVRHWSISHGHIQAARILESKGGGIKKSGHGEGSRGGHIIGHTRSGKPIYASGERSLFTPEDHKDAYTAHMAQSAYHALKSGDEENVQAHRHAMHASVHEKAIEAAGHKIPNLTSVDHTEAAEALIDAEHKGKHTLGAKNKVIGKTRSGKSVMLHGDFSGPGLKGWTGADHVDAAQHHLMHAVYHHHRMVDSSRPHEHDGMIAHHEDQANTHETLAEAHGKKIPDWNAKGEIDRGGDKLLARHHLAMGERRAKRGAQRQGAFEASDAATQATHRANVSGSSADHLEAAHAHLAALKAHHSLKGVRHGLPAANHEAAAKNHFAEHIAQHKLGKSMAAAIQSMSLDELSKALRKASKGEGSRGGKVIGHTRSGKPVYAHTKASASHYKGRSLGRTSTGKTVYSGLGPSDYGDFTRDEHLQAASLHQGAVGVLHDKRREMAQAGRMPHGGSAKYNAVCNKQMDHEHKANEHAAAAEEVGLGKSQDHRAALRKASKGEDSHAGSMMFEEMAKSFTVMAPSTYFWGAATSVTDTNPLS